MGQGVYAGGAAHRTKTRTVLLADRTANDDGHQMVFATAESINQAIQSKKQLHSLAVRAPKSSNNHEILIRALDIFGSVAILLFTMPVMLIISLLIKVLSGGPILYKQKRVGKDGKIFTLYKLRTMINNAEEHTGPIWAAEDDSRVTPIGGILRKTRLDELPQLFNVLWGDMSLVGPRPERPFFVSQHKALQGIRLTVKPGLTGLAQIRSFYNLKPEHKLKYDYLYIQKRSLLLNLNILVRTIPVVLSKRGW